MDSYFLARDIARELEQNPRFLRNRFSNWRVAEAVVSQEGIDWIASEIAKALRAPGPAGPAERYPSSHLAPNGRHEPPVAAVGPV